MTKGSEGEARPPAEPGIWAQRDKGVYYDVVLTQAQRAFTLLDPEDNLSIPTILQGMRLGLPAICVSQVEFLLGLPRGEMAALFGLSVAKFEQKLRNDTFSAQDSELLLRLMRLYAALSEEELEPKNYRRLGTWLLTPNETLETQRPLDLLDTELGLNLVLKVLVREEWVRALKESGGRG